MEPHSFWILNQVKIDLFAETASVLNAESGQNWAINWNRIRFQCEIGSKSGYFLKLHPVQMRNCVKIGLFTETAYVLNAGLSKNWAICWNRTRFQCGIVPKSGDLLKPHSFKMWNWVEISRFIETASILDPELGPNWAFYWNRIRF